jgi:type II secretory pathway pseudopilin PulG
MRQLNNRGFSIVENIVAVGISVVAMAGIVSGLFYMKKMGGEAVLRSTEEKEIIQVIENVRTGIDKYQVTYDTTEAVREKLLALEKLPGAWGPDKISFAKDCPSCPGRYGFIIQPYDTYRGLYMVTVRISHNDWPEKYKDYQFVVSVR